MQTRLQSLYEAVHNTWIGLIISMCIQQFAIAPLALLTQGCHLSVLFNIGATFVFTVVSVARNYGIRRYNVFKLRHGLHNLRGVFAYFIEKEKGTL